MHKYGVIVVGAGHAGCEAALAAARMGIKTAIFTITLDNIGVMSCNPSIGGPAKSHLVKEIDALGGEMAVNSDKTFLQIRVLNTKKGPAVRALRAQIDKKLYHMEMKKTIENCDNLDTIQGMVSEVVVENGKVKGIKTTIGDEYYADCVVLATGTFMRGLIHVGDKKFRGGRMGELPSDELPEALEKIGLKLGRFKTGTPPRIDAKSIAYDKIDPQPGDEGEPLKFSSKTDDKEVIERKQLPCYITYTNETVHGFVLNNLDRAPLFNGSINGVGPRYCPSVEDKIVRYRDKPRHHIFLEPEGYNTTEIYVNGLSTSLPADIQYNMVKNITGLEDAKIMRYGYAIEYDYILNEEIKFTLETKKIEGLFIAGQINGTSGYEEAAAQGLIAGINAARKVQNKDGIVLDRAVSYIGTLIDDLVTKGTNEPYRMMTSRAEYRLLLRQDNADLRLTEKGHEIGLISDERYKKFIEKKELIEKEKERLQKTIVKPTEKVNNYLKEQGTSELTTGSKLAELLKRTEITYASLAEIDENRPELPEQVKEEVEIQVKYDGYIKLQEMQVEKFKKMEKKLIPDDINYDEVKGICLEARQKLNKHRPHSIGQASRISGVSPADISVLLVYLQTIKAKK